MISSDAEIAIDNFFKHCDYVDSRTTLHLILKHHPELEHENHASIQNAIVKRAREINGEGGNATYHPHN